MRYIINHPGVEQKSTHIDIANFRNLLENFNLHEGLISSGIRALNFNNEPKRVILGELSIDVYPDDDSGLIVKILEEVLEEILEDDFL